MPENVPSVITCSIGKDRTGIMSALIQDVCDVPHEQIIAGFAESAVSAAVEKIYTIIGGIRQILFQFLSQVCRILQF